MNVLKELKKVNAQRSEQGFGFKLTDWNLSQWSNAVAGECGELCNLVKKVERGDYMKKHFKSAGPNAELDYVEACAKNDYRQEIGKEAADIVIYLDLLCQREGIDLASEIVHKFNEVSDRVKSPIKIPV